MSWFSRKKSASPTPQVTSVQQDRPIQQDPPVPPKRFPPRLTSLGYEARVIKGLERILPPVCEVPAGKFLMGSKRDSGAFDNEKPRRKLDLPAFQIARYPVTVAEYACFVRAGQNNPNRWDEQFGKLDHPVVMVTWLDAIAYADWLAQQSGQPWRLPSEAEWEKAARGTDGRIYPWGNSFDKSRCNTREGGPHTTTPVGSYPNGASPYGVQDMAGNVEEWTSSIYKPYPYTRNDGREVVYYTDSRVLSRGYYTESRVLRGGSWDLDSGFARVASRMFYNPDVARLFLGFRLARSVPS